MSHPYDYDDLSFADFQELIKELFSGDVIELKEKLDGTNIQATVNKDGEVNIADATDIQRYLAQLINDFD